MTKLHAFTLSWFQSSIDSYKEKEITELHEMMTRIDKALRGNGKPGLFTDIAVLKLKLDELQRGQLRPY